VSIIAVDLIVVSFNPPKQGERFTPGMAKAIVEDQHQFDDVPGSGSCPRHHLL
jgi:hypothetical protein